MNIETSPAQGKTEPTTYHTITNAIEAMESILYDNDHQLSLHQLKSVHERLEDLVVALKDVTSTEKKPEDSLKEIFEQATQTASTVASSVTSLGTILTKWAKKHQSRFDNTRMALASDEEEILSKRSRYVIMLDNLCQKVPTLSHQALQSIRGQVVEVLDAIDRQLQGKRR